MTKEKQDILYEKYREYLEPLPGEERYPLPMFGIECGDGWFVPIDRLLANIKHHLDWKLKCLERSETTEDKEKLKTLLERPFKVRQIKEKFGGLRFYTNWQDDTIGGMIRITEAWCWTVCERCGSNAEVVTKGQGYISTLCEVCRSKPSD